MAEVTKQIATWLEDDKQDWGSGYAYKLGGEDEEMAEAMDAVVKNFPLSMFISVKPLKKVTSLSS